MLKALLLDHDGTLVDSETLHGEHWQHTLAQFGVTLSLEDYLKHYAGYSTLRNAADFLTLYPHIPLSVSDLAQIKNQCTADFLAQQAFPLMPSAQALILWANATGLQQAIVTGGKRSSVQRTLSYNQLEPYISVITSQEDVLHNKPAPDGYLLTLQRLGLEAHETLAIEDNARGLKAALDAGVPCMVVRNYFSWQQDFSGALVCVDSLTEGLVWLKQRYS